MTTLTKICIAGVTDPTSVGGLAAYQRWLCADLKKQGFDVSSLSLLSKHQSRKATKGNSDMATPIGLTMFNPVALKIFRSLASRPFLHCFAELFACSLSKDLRLNVNNYGPNVIHFIGTGWLIVGFALRRIAARSGAVFSVWPAIHANSWGDDVLDLRLYKSAGAVFCQSSFEASHLTALGHTSKNLVKCGLPALCCSGGQPSKLRSQLGLSDEPIVFFLGRRDEGKGYFALLKAWPKVVALFPNAQLLIAGPGDPAPDMKNVHDLRCVDEKTKADAYSACNIFCLPSAHESFGIVYVEAWSYSKPVICGEASASRELISDNWNGLYSSHNVNELSTAITKLLGSYSLQSQLGANGKLTEQTYYCPTKIVEQHLKAWKLTSRNTQ